MLQKDLELLQNVLEVLTCPVPERSLLLWLISCTLLICASPWLCPALSCRLLRSLPTLSHPCCASDFIHAPGDFWLQGSADSSVHVVGGIQQPDVLMISGELLPEKLLLILLPAVAAASFCHGWTTTGTEREAGNGQRRVKTRRTSVHSWGWAML